MNFILVPDQARWKMQNLGKYKQLQGEKIVSGIFGILPIYSKLRKWGFRPFLVLDRFDAWVVLDRPWTVET